MCLILGWGFGESPSMPTLGKTISMEQVDESKMVLALPNTKSTSLNPDTSVNFVDDVTADTATVIRVI